MRPGIRRFAFGASVTFAALFAAATIAQAQTDVTNSPSIAALTAVSSSLSTAPTSTIVPRIDISFQPPAAQAPTKRTETTQSGIGIGIVGGIVRTSFHASSGSNLINSRTGSMFGLWIGGNKNGTVGFVGEFLYVTTGSAPRLKSLEIPAVFHINFGSHDRNGAQGYIVLGPVFTINLNKTISSGVTGGNFKSATTGVIGGVGFEVIRIGVEVRGNWSLTSINNSGGGTITPYRTRTVEFLGKFRFN